MPTPAKRPRRTIADGRALLADWQSSGLTPRAFCQAQHISPKRIDFWKRRIRRLDQAKATPRPSTFIQVKPLPAARLAPASTITATLPNGLTVSIPPGIDVPWTSTVISALLRLATPC